jgi:hypothetical protein
MSVSNDTVTIITKPQLVNINIEESTGDVNINTIPEFITVQVGAVVTTSAGVFVIGEEPNGIINGMNATFTTDNGFVPETIQVFVNGVSQTNGIDYTTTGTQTININYSLVVGDIIRVNYKIG